MVVVPQQISWHYETLPPNTRIALDFLSAEEWIKESEWYLAGGTALALQVGNRTSFDLNFFTTEKDFDEKKLLAHCIGNDNWGTDIEEKKHYIRSIV